MYKYKSLQEVQLPWEHLSFLQDFTKYLKQEVNNDLSVCVDERSLCGLSITGDIKITTPNGEVPYQLLHGAAFTAQIW